MLDEIKRIVSNGMTEKDFESIVLSDEKCKTELTSIINSIKDGGSIDEIFDTIKKEIKEQVLCEVIIDIIISDIKPFKETTFLRSMDFDNFKYLITYMFENVIIQIESKHVIKEAVDLDDQKVEYMCRLLYTVLEWVINKRYSYQHFEYSFNDMFRFDMNKIEFLWEGWLIQNL